MKEETISSSGDPLLPPKSSSPPLALTPAASSAGGSSPAVPAKAGSIDWLAHGQGSKVGSLSWVGSQPIGTSLSASASGFAPGSSQRQCRPWERGDLLRRLSTFKPVNWFGKPKVASSLACARRGWVNIDVDKIECESCGANLIFISPATYTPAEAGSRGQDFAERLDAGHMLTCPWIGNSCAESLVQFPPIPPSALIGGYKDRCDGFLQFSSLPVVAASAIEQMQVSRPAEIDRLLVQAHAFGAGKSGFKLDFMSGTENPRDDVFYIYCSAQKLISLCGWEPRWLPNIQDCEEHSAQSARNGRSNGLTKYQRHLQNHDLGKVLSTSTKKDSGKNDILSHKSSRESSSPLLDCSLCGATVRIWDFRTVSRPVCFAPNDVDIPETSKKMILTRGASAASGISGWVATDGMEKEQTEDHDETATTDERKPLSNTGVDLNLRMAGGLSSTQLHMTVMSEQHHDAHRGRDQIIGQLSSSEVGDHAASYESRGPTTRKRNLEEGGSTVDRPHLMMQQADSIEGIIIDRDIDEVNDGKQYSVGPSKRARDSDVFETPSSYRRDPLGAGPSRSSGFETGIDACRDDPFDQENEQVIGNPPIRDLTHASSVMAMDTICHGADNDSMESVENYPGDIDDIHFPPTMMFRNPDLNDMSELNYSNQAQQSNFPAMARIAGEIGVSSTNDDEEALNTDTTAAQGRDGLSFGISGGSVGIGASHEAEIHGSDVYIRRADTVVGDVEAVAEVTENRGQTGEFVPDPGQMGDFVPEDIDGEDLHGDSQDLMSRSVGRADSGSKIVGSTKAESVESGEKTSNMLSLPHENSVHPSLSCNAILFSGYGASKEEVTQDGKTLPVVNSDYPDFVANGIVPPNGKSNYEEAVEFDPIKHHNYFCPWVNGNVAAAGCAGNSGSSSNGGTADAIALCGWQLTLDALDAFQSLGNLPIQTVESESAASLHKEDHLTHGQKLLSHHSFNRSCGQS